MRVSVVGAGIMGLSAAWALSRRGHRVTVYEQGPVPNSRGSSVDEHRLIRYAYGGEAGYARMVGEAYRAWDMIWADLGESFYVSTGTLVLAGPERGWAEDAADVLHGLGHGLEWLAAGALRRRFPALRTPDAGRGLLLDTGGVLRAERIVAALAAHLARTGVAIVAGTAVAEVDPARARVRPSGGAWVDADALVVAAGAWLTKLLPGLAGRITPSRQLIAYLEPPAEHAEAWARSPMVLDIDPEAGFYLVPPVAGTRLKVGDHRFRLSGDADDPRDVQHGEVEALINLCRPRLAGAERYRVVETRVCFYSVEARERFVVEPVEAAWLVSACSGHAFKFAPVLGLALAAAVEGERPAAGLSRWAAGQGA